MIVLLMVHRSTSGENGPEVGGGGGLPIKSLWQAYVMTWENMSLQECDLTLDDWVMEVYDLKSRPH